MATTYLADASTIGTLIVNLFTKAQPYIMWAIVLVAAYSIFTVLWDHFEDAKNPGKKEGDKSWYAAIKKIVQIVVAAIVIAIIVPNLLNLLQSVVGSESDSTFSMRSEYLNVLYLNEV